MSDQSRSSSRQSEAGTPRQPGGPASFVTTFLLAILLMTGPLVLGADRLWIELPLFGVVTLVLLIQGLRRPARPLPGRVALKPMPST